jgi:hypothetical protein
MINEKIEKVICFISGYVSLLIWWQIVTKIINNNSNLLSLSFMVILFGSFMYICMCVCVCVCVCRFVLRKTRHSFKLKILIQLAFGSNEHTCIVIAIIL